MENMKLYYDFWGGKEPRKNDCVEDPDCDGKVIIKWT
jgi:hypothetical protein